MPHQEADTAGGRHPGFAGPGTFVVPNQSAKISKEANQEVNDRIGEGPGEGLRPGRQRIFAEDLSNTETRFAVAASLERQDAVAIEEAKVSTNIVTTTPIAGASTSEQRVINIQNLTIGSKKGSADVIRARQNLQRTCNHSFSFATKRCTFCNKLRTSHVFDT